ncbi:MAG: hypothetical protein ACT4QC_23685 [Planctomycetaceae bacterium]
MTSNVWCKRRVTRLIVPVLLVAFSGCSDPGASIVEDGRKNQVIRQSAEDTLTAQGAKISLEQLPYLGGEGIVVDLSGVPNITDETLALLKQVQTGATGAMKWLTRINLNGTNVTDEQIANLNDTELAAMLMQLNLRNTAISDKGLQELTNLRSLNELDLTNTKVTPEGVQAFLKVLANNSDKSRRLPKIKR